MIWTKPVRLNSALIEPAGILVFQGFPKNEVAHAVAKLAADLGKQVMRVDLSQVVGKYIGETEKNLMRVLEKAESKEWVIFFDEADALFGKRTGVKDSHDRYANRKINYLLHRIEKYPGTVVMATTMSKHRKKFLGRSW